MEPENGPMVYTIFHLLTQVVFGFHVLLCREYVAVAVREHHRNSATRFVLSKRPPSPPGAATRAASPRLCASIVTAADVELESHADEVGLLSRRSWTSVRAVGWSGERSGGKKIRLRFGNAQVGHAVKHCTVFFSTSV